MILKVFLDFIIQLHQRAFYAGLVHHLSKLIFLQILLALQEVDGVSAVLDNHDQDLFAVYYRVFLPQADYFFVRHCELR